MTFTPAGPTSVFVFSVIVAFVLASLVEGVRVANRRLGIAGDRRAMFVGAAAGAWLLALSFIVASGTIAAKPMPRLLFFFAAGNLAGLVLGLTPVGGWLARGLPLWTLVAFQGFRLPLELVLHSWAEQGTIPHTMTWGGSNYDVVSGVVAVAAAAIMWRLGTYDSRARMAAWIANAVGIVLLVNVARVAVLSSPLPFAWRGVEPPLQLGMYLPYALIGPVCVAGALAGHVILTRALLYTRPRT
ncbi:MAG TPA: hypothetical protein VNK41_11950 [Vicinamibacterales bacterium]|nr:hypothetical protein [Vicinamibacterales bacterium]